MREHVAIPLPMCTSLCFGGADLRDLYIVSGAEGGSHARAGAVFKTRVAVPGLPVARARVTLTDMSLTDKGAS
jgi:gluconolactonase